MAALDTLQEAYQYCDQIARNRARNFYPAFRFLPRPRRLALSAFYAYCSLSDDLADDQQPTSRSERQQLLEQWQSSLIRCFDAQADNPIFLALGDARQKFDLPRQPFFDLLDGIRMDLEPRRYATFDDLELYCRRVASSVGLVSLRIFGCTNSGAVHYANNLGIAFQLTNILRDIGEDLSRNRLYLPLEDLERFRYSEGDLRQRVYDARFLALMTFQYQRAWGYFRAAQPSLAGAQARRLFPAQVMKAVYWRTLHELKRRGFRVLERRITIPWWRKASGVGMAVLREFVRA